MSGAPFLSSAWYRVAALRPRLRAHAAVTRHRYRGGSWYVVHDNATGRLYRLRAATYIVVGRMDGTRTVDQLWQEAAEILGEEAPSQDELIQLMAQLAAADLLQSEVTPDTAGLLARADRNERALRLRNLLNPLAYRASLWHPDKFFDRTIPLFGWFFSFLGALLWLAVVAPAFMLGALHWQELASDISARVLAADKIALMALTFIVLKALHELGHGYAVKAFGGAVHEIGFMFLVFAPMPYVDASAAGEFRSKWQRAVVGAAGMIVEVFVAALAFYVWLAVEPGLIQSLAYNVMWVAGVSTVLFNGNPLLRYDGYYILSDLLEIPNLAQRAVRYWRYLLERYAFRIDGIERFQVTPSERAWLLVYAPASFAYRQIVMIAIALFISSEYLAVGIAIALWSLLLGLVLPIGKALWQVLASPRYARRRGRVIATTAGAMSVLAATLVLVPAPLSTTAEGVIWLPDNAQVRAATHGFVIQLAKEPGSMVSPGEALVESDDPTLRWQIRGLRERLIELEARFVAEQFKDRVSAAVTAAELAYARSELATTSERAARLVTRSAASGTFHVVRPQDLPERFVKEGQLLGYVLPSGSRIVRATISQDEIDLVRSRLRSTQVRLAERLDETYEARIVRAVPAGREDLPSKALGGPAGGSTAVDLRDTQGVKALQRVFQVDIELPSVAAAAFGSRVQVRFEHDWEPLAQQVWRRVRQLLLARLQI